jgi:hypothetical protein
MVYLQFRPIALQSWLQSSHEGTDLTVPFRLAEKNHHAMENNLGALDAAAIG